MVNGIIVTTMSFFTLASIYGTDASGAQQMPITNNSLRCIP